MFLISRNFVAAKLAPPPGNFHIRIRKLAMLPQVECAEVLMPYTRILTGILNVMCIGYKVI